MGWWLHVTRECCGNHHPTLLPASRLRDKPHDPGKQQEDTQRKSELLHSADADCDHADAD
jgi:hypothetical protein